jgi:roadblock/LC7 domain-containing protein
MKFDTFAGNRRSRRQSSLGNAPAVVESLETRSLLSAGPVIVSPANNATLTSAQPTITWNAVANATSYDLWITDSETRERIVFKEGITATSTKLTSAEQLHLGMNRIWVRATLSTGGKSDWGPFRDVLVQAKPKVTGPTNPADAATPPKIDGDDWAVTWTGLPGAQSYEVMVSNQTEQTSTTYTVQNLTPVVNANGQFDNSLIENPAIEITSANHGLTTGDTVRISGVQGISAANGTFAVTVLSPNVFSLAGKIGTGTYASGGKWVRVTGGVAASATTAKTITRVVNTSTGYALENEVRSLSLSGAVAVTGATPQAITNVVNRSYVDVISAGHGLATGNRVRITGVLGNTAANGTYTVTRISENVFRLNGVVGTGTYTSGGSWIRMNGNVPATGASSRAISNVANTQAVEITSAAHGLKTGEKVRIIGVQGNTAANGEFLVTVINANVIQLRGVTGGAAYTSGGTLTRLTELRSDLKMGKYRVFVRSKDDAGRFSAWSTAYDFEVAPVVTLTRPQGATLQSRPLLEWQPVSGATHYQLEVYEAGSATPLYQEGYLTTTSYQLPVALTTNPVQNLEFRVRARRLHQVVTVQLAGSPAAGSFRLSFATNSKTPQTLQTGSLSYSSTAAEIATAVRALDGFSGATVTSVGTAPNLTFVIQIPLVGNGATPMVLGGNPVKASLVGTVTPGTITLVSKTSTPVDGLWSDRLAFSSVQKPVVTGPVGVDTADPAAPPLVTELRPTITWTTIDKAARYEIWVERSASPTTYLRTTSTTASYRFPTNILEGNYTVRVRAVSTTGTFTDWSDLYSFKATAGVAVITPVQVQGTPVLTANGPAPTIQWTAVADAARYEVQIAWLNVNFDFIHPTNLTTNEFTPAGNLAAGTYRVWVRAILANGTTLGWSKPVDFVVTAQLSDTPEMDNLDLASLTSSLNGDGEDEQMSEQPTAEEYANAVAITTESPAHFVRSTPGADSLYATPPAESNEETSVESQMIQTLAEGCVAQEWWAQV